LHQAYILPSSCVSNSFPFISITFLQAPPETQHEPVCFSLETTGVANSTEILRDSQHGNLPTVNTDLSLKRLCNERRERGCLVYTLMALIEVTNPVPYK